MNVERQLKKMEEETRAIKASFEQAAAMMDVYSTSIQFSTSPNIIHWNGHGHFSPDQYEYLAALRGGTSDLDGNHTGYGQERVVVTFDCDKGQNIFASLEIDLIDSGSWAVWCRRITYAGGARWVVLFQVNSVTDHGTWVNWKPNVVRFTVESAAPGTLGAKMIWQ